MKKAFWVVVILAVLGAGYYYYEYIDTLTVKDMIGDTDNRAVGWMVEKIDFDTGLTRNDLKRLQRAFDRKQKEMGKFTREDLLNDPELAKYKATLEKLPKRTVEWMTESLER
jgi:hypothetical protein